MLAHRKRVYKAKTAIAYISFVTFHYTYCNEKLLFYLKRKFSSNIEHCKGTLFIFNCLLQLFTFQFKWIGRGVFTTRPFHKGEFLLVYRGKLLTKVEGEKREEQYPQEVNFLFFFEHKGKQYW